MAPRTRYAKHGDQNIAYQVVGEGPLEIVIVPSFVSHLDFSWAHPAVKAWLDSLTRFSRVVLFDKAGTGLSDPVSAAPTLEERVAEIEAVIDAAGVERPALFGLSEGGPSSIMFAAGRPERVRALVLFGTYAFGAHLFPETVDIVELFASSGRDERYLPSPQQRERLAQLQRAAWDEWGEGKALKLLVPSQGDVQQLAVLERVAASPGMARATLESAARLDVTGVLASVQVPTLVVHARDDIVPLQAGQYLADHIPGAQMLIVDGADHAPWLTDPDAISGEVEQFLTGGRGAAVPDRVLATVLFTDIVSSTERAAELGDARWRAVLESHDEITRATIERFGGTAVKSTGDGVLATFDGPAQAIRCAGVLNADVSAAGVEIRTGIHTGECELIGDDVGGLAVHIAARVNASAAPGEILVSRTVRDLVVGSGIGFAGRGEHDLKGVPGRWELLAVASGRESADEPDAVPSIDTPAPGDAMRAGDRVVAVVAKRAPGVLRRVSRASERRARSRAAS